MSEFFLAKCLLTLSGTPGTLKIPMLGEVVGVSESTAVRFPAALGFSGYPEFQKALEDILQEKIHSFDRIYSAILLCPLLSPDILTLMRLNTSVCCSKSFIIYKKLFKIWQFFYPVTEGMPLCKLMTLSRIIYSNKILIIESTCSHLVITFREKLYHAVP